MSYARFSDDSDVYVYLGHTGYVCCGCEWGEGKGLSWWCNTEKEMLDHLERHRVHGDTVPQYAVDRLTEEMNTNKGECDEG